MQQTDPFSELVMRAKAGDKDAFGEIYQTHVTPLYRYLFARTRDKSEAEDLTQETFLRAYQSLARFEVVHDNFLPYLFTVARNLMINRGKKKKPDYLPGEEIDRTADASSTSAYAESKELSAQLLLAMEVLTESEREIVELRFYGERTYTEIAAICEKKEDAVRQHVARALKKMRLSMGKTA